MATAVLTLFAGLRANCVGADTVQYQYIYEYLLNANSLKQLLLWRSYEDRAAEVGYYILEYFCHLYMNYNCFKLLCASITLIPVGYIIYKYSEKPAISFLLFFCLPIYTLLSMSAMRQGLAFGVCILAMDYLLRRKWKGYVVCVILASLFHNTAIILLPLYFINKIQYNRNLNWIIFAATLAVYVFRYIIFLFFNSYSRIDYEAGDAGGTGMLLFLIMIFATSYFVSEENLSKDFNKTMLLLLAFTILCWLIGLNLAAIFRLAAYTEFYICLFVSNTLSCINKVALRKLVITLICFGVIAVMSKLVLRESDGSVYTYYPYYFNWEK